MRALSTVAGSSLPFWRERVDTIKLASPYVGGISGALLGLPIAVVVGVRLWWVSRHYDAFLCEPGLPTAICGLLRALSRLRQPRLLVLENLHNYQTNALTRFVKKLQMRLILSCNAKAVVYTRAERHRMSRYFGIPAERFIFIPYHSTLFAHPELANENVPPDNYIFAGGESLRDYKTLFEAVDGTDERVIVAIRSREVLQGLRVPANVELVTTDHLGFLRLMQRAKINVVPLASGTLRSAGQQTYLNAMAMGTVTIVTEIEGAGDYIDNGTDGFLVEPGNSTALRKTIHHVSQSPEIASRVRREARRKAARYETEVVMLGYLQVVARDDLWQPNVSEFLPIGPEDGECIDTPRV